MITKPQALVLLDYINHHPFESREPGVFYVSAASLNRMGIPQWDLLNQPFHCGHEHYVDGKDIILHRIDRADLEDFANVNAGFLQRLAFKGRDTRSK